jgi:hypothetical protein
VEPVPDTLLLRKYHRGSRMYDYITELCRTQTEVILKYVNPNVCGNGQGVARRR